MRYLKQSTSVDVPVGPFLDNVDGFTAETALTITQPDVRLKKNGAAWDQKAAAQTLAHEENGNYEVTLDATDTDTIGLLRLHIAESGALPVWDDFHILAANVYDALFGAATVKLQVDTAQLSGDATAADNAEAFFDGTGYAGTNNVIPTVTTVTNQVTANTTAISGDTVAADNLETMLDGTGGQIFSLKQLNCVNTTGDAIVAQSTGANGRGMACLGNGTGPGLLGVGGATAGGIVGSGGSTSGPGVQCISATSAGLLSTGGTNSHGADFVGTGSGHGMHAGGGATGHGWFSEGGATSGDGFRTVATLSGNGTTSLGAGGGHGTRSAGGATGHGMLSEGGATSGDGFRLTVVSGIPLNDDFHTGLAQAGSTASTIVLAAAAPANDDLFNGLLVAIHTGTGARQARLIQDYDGTTKTATITPNWDTTPASGDAYAIIEWGPVPLEPSNSPDQHSGTTQAGAAGTITLAASASATNDLYNGQPIKIYAGTGAGQTRGITDYVGATKVVTVDRNWITIPDNTSRYVVLADNVPALDAILLGVQVSASGIAATAFQAGAINAAAVADGTIDAATFAAGAVNAAALASDAVDEIWAKAMVELTTVPGVTGTTLQALTWVFELARNRITQTATTQTVFRDDATTPLATSTVNDDGTIFSRTEFA
jgi:hypothetical protein